MGESGIGSRKVGEVMAVGQFAAVVNVSGWVGEVM